MKKLISWDTSEIAENEIKFRLEDKAENLPELSEEAIREAVYSDPDIYSSEWDCLVDYLTEILEKKNKGIYWKASVNNFGWRNLDGLKYFKAKGGQELLGEVLPKTDCTFYIYNFKNGIAIQNYHHDSPMGKEWYYIKPCAESTYYKNN